MARLDINIVTSLVGAGLEREALLLKELFSHHDIYTNMMHYTTLSAPMVRSDVTIFLEVVMPQALSLSRENWLVPNCEWWDSKNDRFLNHFSKIICKTKDCYDIWVRKFDPKRVFYTSFEARDLYLPDVPRELKCLHIAGKSEHKNTQAVCDAWRQLATTQNNCPLPPLTIVSRAPCFDTQWENPFPHKNVTRIARAEEADIIQLMNSHMIHIMPSMYEGFGHVLHEGLGCGALVMTTNAPPMNEYAGIYKPWLLPVMTRSQRSLANLNIVAGKDIKEKLSHSLYWLYNKPQEIEVVRREAREAFLLNRNFFRENIMKLIDGIHK